MLTVNSDYRENMNADVPCTVNDIKDIHYPSINVPMKTFRHNVTLTFVYIVLEVEHENWWIYFLSGDTIDKWLFFSEQLQHCNYLENP